MYRSSAPLLSFAAALIIPTVVSLQVSPGSSCSAICLDDPTGNPLDANASSTNVSDIVCSDVDYFTTGTGTKYRNCIDCLQKSTKVDGAESDVAWLLYNLRYAVNVCMFGFPKPVRNVSSPCNIDFACGPLQNALRTGDLAPDGSSQLDYCRTDGGMFGGQQITACVQCLQASSDQSYLANFLTALEAGCKQQPEPGDLLGLSGTLFSKSAVTITAPSSASGESPLPPSGSGTKLTVGAIVGIVVGASLLVIGGLSLLFVYCRRKRIQREQERQLPMSSMYPRSIGSSLRVAGENGPPSGYAHSFDHKKSFSLGDISGKPGHSSYTTNGEYYDKLEEEALSRQHIGQGVSRSSQRSYAYDPRNNQSGPGNALPTHPAYNPQTRSRNASPQPSAKSFGDEYSNYRNSVDESDFGGTPGLGPTTGGSRASSRHRSGSIMSGQTVVTTVNGQLSPPLHVAVPGSNGSIGASSSMPMPPPPPRGPKVPALILPSVPRIRVPKKYSPPKIVVQGATPVVDDEESREMKISGPLAFHDEERFVDRPLGMGAAVDSAAAAAAGGTGAAAGPARSPPSLGSIRGRSGSGSSNAEGNTGADASRSGAAGQAITTTFTSLSDGRIIEQQVTLNPGGPGILSPEVIRSGKSMLYG